MMQTSSPFRDAFENQGSQPQRTVPPTSRRQLEIKKKVWSVENTESDDNHHGNYSLVYQSNDGIDVRRNRNPQNFPSTDVRSSF